MTRSTAAKPRSTKRRTGCSGGSSRRACGPRSASRISSRVDSARAGARRGFRAGFGCGSRSGFGSGPRRGSGFPSLFGAAHGRAPTPRGRLRPGPTPRCRRRRPRRHCHRRDRRGVVAAGVATRSTQRRLGDQPDARPSRRCRHDEREEGLGAVRVHGTRAASGASRMSVFSWSSGGTPSTVSRLDSTPPTPSSKPARWQPPVRVRGVRGHEDDGRVLVDRDLVVGGEPASTDVLSELIAGQSVPRRPTSSATSRVGRCRGCSRWCRRRLAAAQG